MAEVLPFARQTATGIEPGVAPVATSEAPRSQISESEVAQPFAELGRAMDKTGTALEDLAVPFAEKAGAQAVTRGADGSLTVSAAPIIGPAGEAYTRAAKVSALAEADGEAKRQDIAMRQEFASDPSGYQAAANAFKQKTVQQYTAVAGPEVGEAVGRAVDSTTTFTYRALLNQQQTRIRENFNKSTQAAIESKSQDLTDLIAGGGAGTQQARVLASEIHQLMYERVSNPILGEPQEVADLKSKELNEQIGAAGATYRVNQVLKGASPYQGMADAASQKYNLNPVLFTRQLNQESGFNPAAESKAGAVGIAQFMPETAAKYGVNARDPASSIEGAAHYMADLTKQFGGNQGLALAAYNWGPGNMAAWMASGGNPNAMPAETRNYVKSITGRSISDWASGNHPSVSDIQNLSTGTPGNNMDAALRVAQSMRDDQSLPERQRIMNYDAGVKAIKDFQEAQTRAANLAEKQQKATDNAFEGKVIDDSASPNPTITAYDIKTNPNISAESKMRMLAWVNRDGANEPDSKLSDTTTAELFRRIHLPEGDPRKISDPGAIRDAYAPSDGSQPKLRRADEQFLEKTLTETMTPKGQTLLDNRREFFKRYAATIDPSIEQTGQPTAAGNQQFYLAEKDAMAQEDVLRAKGEDPASLYDPRSPNFFGKPDNMAKYNKSLADKLHENAPGVAAGYTQVPANMTPQQAMTAYKPGTRIRLPDGRFGTVPWPTLPVETQ
jgi:soluble lytic murein transglycosylase-like protein